MLQTTVRRRSTAALFATAALMNAAMAIASPVSTILAADRAGTAWAALPNTAGIVGTGVGALAITRLAGRRGWRQGLTAGYAAATAGAALAGATTDLVLLCLGMGLLGLGNAGGLLARYVAAENHPAAEKGTAIGLVVWAAAIGAVGGPLLLGVAGTVDPFLIAGLATTLAAAAATTLPAGPPRRTARVGKPFRTPAARTALAVMATAQVVMVLVMTAAPLDLHQHHHALGAVGVVLSAHTLGMFGLSPLTGRLLDRFGSGPVMLAGLATLALSTGFAATSTGPGPQAAALFLLGYGWNLCFIGGSGRLAGGLPAEERTSVEGAVDSAVWMLAAAGSLASSLVLAGGGYPILVALAGSLVIFPAAVLAWR
jgi:MFS family permease